MPRHTPYHYSFNSPLVWRDPSGLAQENEKDRDRLMETFLPLVNESEGSLLQTVEETDYDGGRARALDAQLWKQYLAFTATTVGEGKYNYGPEGGRTGEGGSGEKGAWDIKNQWTEEMIEKYRIFSERQAKLYQDMGREFTCEDFALQIMIDFASDNNLPFAIETESGVFDASDAKWGGDLMKFRNAVLDATGANDLISFGNTISIERNDLSKGDLMIQLRPNGRGRHVQVVTDVGQHFIEIKQGRQGAGSANPQMPSWLYAGTRVTTGYFSRDGSFINTYYKDQYPPGFIQQFVFRQWNFNHFNKIRK
jgi:hypothetical protein